MMANPDWPEKNRLGNAAYCWLYLLTGNPVDEIGWGSTVAWVRMLVHRKHAGFRPLPGWLISLTTMAGVHRGLGGKARWRKLHGGSTPPGWGIPLTTIAGVNRGLGGDLVDRNGRGFHRLLGGDLVDHNEWGSTRVWVGKLVDRKVWGPPVPGWGFCLAKMVVGGPPFLQSLKVIHF